MLIEKVLGMAILIIKLTGGCLVPWLYFVALHFVRLLSMLQAIVLVMPYVVDIGGAWVWLVAIVIAQAGSLVVNNAMLHADKIRIWKLSSYKCSSIFP